MQTKILLSEREIPTHWYNVVADMPNPPAPVLGADGKPIGPDALSAIFPDTLIEREVSAQRWIPIPESIREIYRLWRPSPLYRAHRLEQELDTPARIYNKNEGVSPTGSHKTNSAVAQAWYNKQAGISRLATETGARQWGSAISLAGRMFGAFPFFADKAAGKDIRLVAVEPTSCPTLTQGYYAYDFGDTAGLTPLMLQYTLGHDFVPPGIHAGGLRYHGDSVLVSQLHNEGLVDAVAVPQNPTFEAGLTFARTEGIIPAPESNHAIRSAIVEALECNKSGEARTIFFNLSGHGHFDMAAYDKYFAGELEDYAYPQKAIEQALHHLPQVNLD